MIHKQVRGQLIKNLSEDAVVEHYRIFLNMDFYFILSVKHFKDILTSYLWLLVKLCF